MGVFLSCLQKIKNVSPTAHSISVFISVHPRRTHFAAKDLTWLEHHRNSAMVTHLWFSRWKLKAIMDRKSGAGIDARLLIDLHTHVGKMLEHVRIGWTLVQLL